VTFAPRASFQLPAFLILLTILALHPQSASAQSAASQSLSLRDYVGELDRCSALLNASPIDPAAVHAFRTSLPSSWDVNTGEAHYAVPTQWLSGDLFEIEKNPSAHTPALEQARLKLQLYRNDAQSLADSLASQRNLAEPRGRINAILNSRGYRGQEGPTWFDVLWQKIRSWIDRKLEKIFGPIRRKAVGNLVAWIAIGLAAALLLFWTVRFLLHTGRSSEMDLSGAAPVGHDWRRWLREAREAAGRGDFRAAIHAAYWTAIVRMEETNSLPEDRSRTPRESLKLVGSGSAAYAPLAQLTRRFELVWYGYRAATATDWDDAAQQLETLGCPRS
jgi:Domain of unknown function (DUF4129)